VRVLDPACGSGNFLYVTLEHLKRLEAEVLAQAEALGDTQGKLGLEGETVTLQQLRGIEINERAAALAELVLWIGWLQWHIRSFGSTSLAEPVIHDYGNIEHRDAVLAWDGQEPMRDASGALVTRWDGTLRLPGHRWPKASINDRLHFSHAPQRLDEPHPFKGHATRTRCAARAALAWLSILAARQQAARETRPRVPVQGQGHLRAWLLLARPQLCEGNQAQVERDLLVSEDRWEQVEGSATHPGPAGSWLARADRIRVCDPTFGNRSVDATIASLSGVGTTCCPTEPRRPNMCSTTVYAYRLSTYCS
jgi:hypothetical protein